MSFVAAISNARNIATWSRACVALAGVSDQISFVVSAQSVSMLAVNSSRTTHGEIHFDHEFFKEISFDVSSESNEGLSWRENDASYSFVVSSKHLSMLLKNSDAYTHNYVCLRVECGAHTPAARLYKLNVEILTKKLVLKKYQISFQPVELTRTNIPERYDALFEDNDIHHFSIHATTIKSFLETSHSSTEDFGIDVKSEKITFHAYTKQVLKDRDYLKQPMSLMISMAVDDLEDSNLHGAHLALNFRLRDFRTFIALVSSFRSEMGRIDSFVSDRQNLTFDTFFQTAGEPVMFQHKSTDFTVNFIQMTTDESGLNPKSQPNTYVIHAPVVQKKRTITAGPKETNISERGQKRQKRSASPAKGTEQAIHAKQAKEASDAEQDEDVFDAFEPSADHVSYGNPKGGRDLFNFEEPLQESGRNDDTDYSSSAENSGMEFGPTQARDKPKALFR